MSCVIWGCKSHSSRKENNQGLLSFHRFPADDDKKKEWLNRIGRRNWTPKRHSHICSKHFTEDSFTCATGNKWRRLREDAMPTLNITDQADEWMSGEYRHVWRIAFTNFLNSFRHIKPRQIRGKHMGTDYIGNQYYEIPAEPSIGKRKPVRWYDPARGLDFEDPIPSEWESWLRQRRPEPPTEEEIANNVAIAELKKVNAAKLEAKRLAEGGSLPSVPERGPASFPTYPDLYPGDASRKIKK